MTEKKADTDKAVKNVQQALGEFRSSLRSLLPAEFWEHRRAARREMLLAARSLVDAAIEHIEQQNAPHQKRAQRIKID
ncbi:MAG: hypothetical protein ACE5F6_04740 [Anaerolineae bacterium]